MDITTHATTTSRPTTTGATAVRPARPLRAFRTPVRGHAFAAPPPDAPDLRAGVPVTLVREPGNPADPLAIAVWVEDETGTRWRIGYLDQVVAGRLAPRLDGGTAVEAVLAGWVPEPSGRWERPLVHLRPAVALRGQDHEAPAGDARAATPLLDRARDAGSTVGVWGRPPGVRRRRLDA